MDRIVLVKRKIKLKCYLIRGILKEVVTSIGSSYQLLLVHGSGKSLSRISQNITYLGAIALENLIYLKWLP